MGHYFIKKMLAPTVGALEKINSPTRVKLRLSDQQQVEII